MLRLGLGLDMLQRLAGTDVLLVQHPLPGVS